MENLKKRTNVKNHEKMCAFYETDGTEPHKTCAFYKTDGTEPYKTCAFHKTDGTEPHKTHAFHKTDVMAQNQGFGISYPPQGGGPKYRIAPFSVFWTPPHRYFLPPQTRRICEDRRVSISRLIGPFGTPSGSSLGSLSAQ